MADEIISARVLQILVNRLADGEAGFNVCYNTYVNGYGVKPATLDFSPNSKHFYRANVDHDELIKTNPIDKTGWLVTLYSIQSLDQAKETSRYFSGIVTVQMEWSKIHPGSKVIHNPEAYLHAVESALSLCLKDVNSSEWMEGTAFDGKMSCQYFRMVSQNDVWRQSMLATMTFELRE